MAVAIAVIFVSPGGRSEREAYEYTEAVQAGLARVLGQNLESIENISFQWIANGSLNKTLVEYAASPELYDVSAPNHVFSDYTEGQVRALPAIEDAIFFDLKERKRKPLTMREEMPVLFLRALRESTLIAQAESSEGRPVWGGPFAVPYRNERLLACARLIREPGGGGIGVLAVLVDERAIAAALNEDLFLDGEPETVRGDYTSLVDSDGRILSSPDPSRLSRKLSEIEPIAEGADGFGDVESGRGRAVGRGTWVFRRLEGMDWFLVTVLPREAASDAPSPFLTVVIKAAAALAFLASALYAFTRLNAAKSAGHGAPAGAGSPDGQGSVNPEALSALNSREREILDRMAAGKTNKEIAYELGIAEQTVKNYVSSLYEKLGVHDRVSAVLRYRGGA